MGYLYGYCCYPFLIGVYIKKDMIPTEQFSAAEAKYPFPYFVDWYRLKFPNRQLTFIAVALVFVGIILTIAKAPLRFIQIAGAGFIVILLFLSVMFMVNWILIRSTNGKRAKYLGLKYKEYIKLINS
jgi:amino acid permease